MKVKAKLNVSTQAYFEFLIEQLLEEIPKNKKRTLNRNDIKEGLTYKQTYKIGEGTFESTKKIITFDYGKCYQLQLEIPDGKQFIKHDVKDLGPNLIEVTYQEWAEGIHMAGKIAYALQTGTKKKEMKRRLAAVEAYILKNQEEA